MSDPYFHPSGTVVRSAPQAILIPPSAACSAHLSLRRSSVHPPSTRIHAIPLEQIVTYRFRLLRLRQRYRMVRYWLCLADPRTWRSSLRTHRWRRQVHAAHNAARLHPYRGADSNTLPAIEVAGVLVFAYLDDQ